MAMATRVLALQAAINATKRRLSAQGQKVAHMPRRDLRTLAEAYLQDHREALLAEASVIVERWRLEGKFGKREPQRLSLFINHAQNGASK
jgi:hypothetical protein